jgi:TRAP-type uncharacterized transport system fused permease subunit
LVLVSVVVLVWPLLDLDAFVHRAATPNTTDIVFGIIAIALVLEATRRTSGWVLPISGDRLPSLRLLRRAARSHRPRSSSRIAATRSRVSSARCT